MALVCVNAFYTGLLSADEAEKCAEKIQKLSNEHLEVSSTCKKNIAFKIKYKGEKKTNKRLRFNPPPVHYQVTQQEGIDLQFV